MRNVLRGLGLAALLAVSALAVPLQAQTAKPVKRTPVPANRYDVRQEVTLKGVVDHVSAKAAKGTPIGGHLFLATPNGTVDTHLGPFAMKGKHPVSVIPGEHVEVTGVMTTIKNNHYFLARTVVAGDRTYTIRNQHGALLHTNSKSTDTQVTSAPAPAFAKGVQR